MAAASEGCLLWSYRVISDATPRIELRTRNRIPEHISIRGGLLFEHGPMGEEAHRYAICLRFASDQRLNSARSRVLFAVGGTIAIRR
ncbi:hypothetical protein KQX54_020818 [Cotesia glomerata]|uniref:Uncharacterized protein n=1 Tax=Cotesia glomerata TaxID=32391 RepID=A0AAV7I4Z7_COTGL|nr:hypothetical protein KQX54_020818 [Cotesia glomerata]